MKRQVVTGLLLIGLCGFSSVGFAKDDIGALQEKAEQGDADAQYLLGVAYHEGRDVPQDDKKAGQWYRRAAEQENADAQYALGVAYYTGLGVTQDDAAAAKWFRRAAEQGNVNAQNDLSVCYAQGTGVSQDNVQAYAWATVAAARGKQESVKAIPALVKKMSPGEIEEGQRLVQEYAETFVKK
jgi:TPR repeat protein